MAPMRTKPTANVTSKKSHRVIDMEIKFKVIKSYEGGKSVTVIAHQSGYKFKRVDITQSVFSDHSGVKIEVNNRKITGTFLMEIKQ